MNKVILIGHISKSPELRYTKNGRSVCKFTLKTETQFNKKTFSHFHHILAFDEQAMKCHQILKEGDLIYVEGPIRYRKYTDKNDVKQSFCEVHAYRIDMLGLDKTKTPSISDILSELEGEEQDSGPVQITTDDIPF